MPILAAKNPKDRREARAAATGTGAGRADEQKGMSWLNFGRRDLWSSIATKRSPAGVGYRGSSIRAASRSEAQNGPVVGPASRRGGRRQRRRCRRRVEGDRGTRRLPGRRTETDYRMGGLRFEAPALFHWVCLTTGFPRLCDFDAALHGILDRFACSPRPGEIPAMAGLACDFCKPD